jgi:uncharacterized protein (DUF1330 family)
MGMVIVHHTVKDYATWKPAYDKHAGARKAAGLNHDHVLQAVDNPNAVTIVMDFSDVGAAKKFVESEDLKTAMKSAGVVGAPTIHLLKKMT